MDIYTAKIGQYYEEDRLDISRKSGDVCLAPSWNLVMDYKNKKISELEYIQRYAKEMRFSWMRNYDKWYNFINKSGEVTLMCYCNPYEFCHRYLLAYFLSFYPNINFKGERNVYDKNGKLEDMIKRFKNTGVVLS